MTDSTLTLTTQLFLFGPMPLVVVISFISYLRTALKKDDKK